jgi:hypothetical protein
MSIKEASLDLAAKVGIFLLKVAGGVGIGIGIGFTLSYLVKHPGRIDTFALVESLLGIVITGLSIVAAFAVAFQWSNLDRKMNEFDIKVKETDEHFNKASERAVKISQDIDNYVKMTIDGYKEKVDYLEKLLKGNERVANEINARIEEYKVLFIGEVKEQNKVIAEKQKEFEEKERCFEERQTEFRKFMHESVKLIEKTIELQVGSEKM